MSSEGRKISSEFKDLAEHKDTLAVGFNTAANLSLWPLILATVVATGTSIADMGDFKASYHGALTGVMVAKGRYLLSLPGAAALGSDYVIGDKPTKQNLSNDGAFAIGFLASWFKLV